DPHHGRHAHRRGRGGQRGGAPREGRGTAGGDRADEPGQRHLEGRERRRGFGGRVMTARLPRDRQRGIALLLVLWAFMILGVLALDFSRYMRDDAMAAVNFADETQGYYVALAGMHKALWQAKVAREGNPATGMRDGSTQDPRSKQNNDDESDDEEGLKADGQWHKDTFHGVEYEVRVTDE